MRRNPHAALLILLASLILTPARLAPAARALSGAGQPRVVTSAADSGPGTLRQALLDARPGDTITFDPQLFSPAAPATIRLASPLPAITQDGLTLDGGSGAGLGGVILDGRAAGGAASGLRIEADGVTVRGLQITGFAGYGIELRGQNNTIGSAPSAGAMSPASLGGNLLSGNGQSGAGLFGAETASNTIAGNLIGTDPTGKLAWGNQRDGVHVNGAHHNLIAANVISGNEGSGVQICCSPDSAHNTVRDNLIGVGLDGLTPVPNAWMGVVLANGANHNTIGPGNVMAYTSSGGGIGVLGGLSPANTILGNSISGNLGGGITLWNENLGLVQPPAIAEFDLAAGVAGGVACPGCLVQVYSDEDNEGRVFEGQAVAGAAGRFLLEAGGPFAGPHLTATATDASGATSAFSVPTSGARSPGLQAGNDHPYQAIPVWPASRLEDNRLGFYVQDQSWVDGGIAGADVLNAMGVKCVRGQMNDPDASSVRWEADERLIHANFDQMITGLAQNGIEMTYILIFWDKEHRRQTGQTSLPRLQTEQEVQRYLDFVRHMVRAFGDRVDAWELWNEPGYDPECDGVPLPAAIQCIPVDTYVQVAKRAIDVIRQEDPGAKIVLPSYHAWDPPELYQGYFYRILESDLMPLVDAVSWHPFIVNLDPVECGGAFFDEYWDTVLPEIQSLAAAHGFQGQFRADELRFAISAPPAGAGGGSPPGAGNPCAVSDRTASKYLLREMVRHLGEDVSPGMVLNGDTQIQVVQRLAGLMAGARPAPLALHAGGQAADAIRYGFSLPGGDHLVAIWRQVDITDQDSALSVTVEAPGFAGHTARAIDLLAGVQQQLDAQEEGDDLVLPGLQLRDYPLLVCLSPPRHIWMPAIRDR